jgi:hypothetical protein
MLCHNLDDSPKLSPLASPLSNFPFLRFAMPPILRFSVRLKPGKEELGLMKMTSRLMIGYMGESRKKPQSSNRYTSWVPRFYISFLDPTPFLHFSISTFLRFSVSPSQSPSFHSPDLATLAIKREERATYSVLLFKQAFPGSPYGVVFTSCCAVLGAF